MIHISITWRKSYSNFACALKASLTKYYTCNLWFYRIAHLQLYLRYEHYLSLCLILVLTRRLIEEENSSELSLTLNEALTIAKKSFHIQDCCINRKLFALYFFF